MAKRPITILTTALLLGVVAPAYAGVTKTWVSSTTGNDAGTCQFTAPCKTFAFAITQTLAGGEIDVKDGGSYGPVTITQAVSIVNNGFLAQISVPQNGIGVTVNAGSSDRVFLKGLVIDGHGTGSDGIVFGGGGDLIVTQCEIRNVTAYGVDMDTAAQSMQIADTIISGTATGLFVSTNGLTASLFNVKLYNNNKGIDTTNNSFVSVADSALIANTYGIYIEGNAQVYLGTSTIAGSGQYAIDIESGGVKSYGDNEIGPNVLDIKGTLGSTARR